MASNNPSQLYLLADHIKLSLLERQRAASLDLEPNAQNGTISRSLDSMRDGVEALEAEVARLDSEGDGSPESLRADTQRLRAQFDDLTAQHHGLPARDPATLQQPNDAALAGDFEHASALSPPAKPASKAVRFRDSPAKGRSRSPSPGEEAARAALFPYQDDPGALEAQRGDDVRGMDNTQIHQYHDQVLRDQDDQLDQLGESISRQRDLGMMIGDELDEHVAMLDEVDSHVDRQQGRLDGARDRLGKIARRANDNKQLTVIIVLVVVLLLLIIILKS